MKLPSSFRRLLRKFAQYAGPVGATTILRGCPCPNPEFRPPQAYTSSLVVDGQRTLDANFTSWEPFCIEKCGEGSTECHVRVNTSEANGLRLTHSCDKINYGPAALAGPSAPWDSLCKKTCGEEQDCLIGPDPARGNMIIINCVSWWVDCAGGRSTEGITAMPPPASQNEMGALLARMATLEAESIPAFRRLARELAALGAPRKLRRQAARSRRDEMRHARVMTSLARRNGVVPAAILVPNQPLPLRKLEEVAFENAIEGCVRETYGAWNAWERARKACDPELRATLVRIALDEVRHASLAWDIHRWAMARLGRPERERIMAAMELSWQQIGRASGINRSTTRP